MKRLTRAGEREVARTECGHSFKDMVTLTPVNDIGIGGVIVVIGTQVG